MTYLASVSSFAQFECDVIRPSINAEQFGLSVKAETALCKGQPSLSIPLMELKCRGYSLPISVSFYGGDVIFSTEASPIGLGWSLNAGGVITKTTKGADDDCNIDKSHHFNGNYIRENYNNWSTRNLFVYSMQMDPMPDEYTYSLPGHSGTIDVNRDGSNTCMKLYPDGIRLQVYPVPY